MTDLLDQAKASRCYAADTCVQDDRCPFASTCSQFSNGETMTDDLTAFLTARYDEAWATANAATPGPWVAIVHTKDDQGVIVDSHYPPGSGFILGTPVMSDDESRNRADVAHIAATDPAHRLADITLKRAILAGHHHYDEYADTKVNYIAFGCGTCHHHSEYGMPKGINWCETVSQLGTEFSGHPDYRAEWAP